MSTLGLAAGIVLVVVAGLAGGARLLRRRRVARQQGPRTVADLVELRSERSAVQPGARDAVQPAVDEPAPAVAAAVDAGDAPADPARPPGEDMGLNGNGSSDTPWNRAQRMLGAPDLPDQEPDTAPAPDAGSALGSNGAGEVGEPEPTAVQQVVVKPEPAAAEQESVPSDTQPEQVQEPGPGAAAVEADPAEADADQSRSRALRLVAPAPDPPVVEIPAQRAPVAESVPARREPADTGDAVPREVAGAQPDADEEAVVVLSGLDDAAAGSDGEPGPAHQVRFRVLGRDGSVPAGASVSLFDGHGREVDSGHADNRGRGELQAPRPARYLLVSTAADHQPGAVPVSTVDGPVDAEVSLVRSASVVGSVRGLRAPVVGARLTLLADGETIDATDSGFDGGYRLTDLAAGAYRLTVDARGCESVELQLAVADGARVQRDIDLAPSGPTGAQASDVDPSDAGSSADGGATVERLMIGNG